jgi:hypothetical protein
MEFIKDLLKNLALLLVIAVALFIIFPEIMIFNFHFSILALY